MTFTRLRRARGAAVLAALCIGAAGAATVHTMSATSCPAPIVITDTTTDAQIAHLMADGWHGDPTDHREALYSPVC